MKHVILLFLLVVLLGVFVGGVLGQEATPAVTPVVATSDTPVIVTAPAALGPSAADYIAYGIGLIGIVALIVQVVIQFKQHGNLQEAYNTLIQGIVGNQWLKGELQSGYANLTDEQKRYADAALSLADLLSRATPDQVDDILQQWTKDIRGQAIITARSAPPPPLKTTHRLG